MSSQRRKQEKKRVAKRLAELKRIFPVGAPTYPRSAYEEFPVFTIKKDGAS